MKFIIKKNFNNVRAFLLEELSISKKYIHKINITTNSILINDKTSNLNTILNKNDILTININTKKSKYIYNKNINNVFIEFEDDFILIASKPFGIKTHPNDIDNENDTLINFLIKDFKYLEPIHRLDIDTCGLVIFAKNPIIKARLDKDLESKLIKRYYTSIVKNKITPQKIITNMGRHIKEKNKMCVTKNGKIAITNILNCKKINNNLFKLELLLETGRTHQIRVHLNHLKNPIIGDKLYSKDFDKYKNMYLGALKIEFIHPITKENIIVTSKYNKFFCNANYNNL